MLYLLPTDPTRIKHIVFCCILLWYYQLDLKLFCVPFLLRCQHIDARVIRLVVLMKNLHVENIDIGIHFSSPPLSPLRDEANCRHEPAIATSVHAPAGPEPVPVDQPTPVESPTPEALHAFKTHWESQGRQPTYQEWLDFM